jgi:hypothetical protein
LSSSQASLSSSLENLQWYLLCLEGETIWEM